MRRRMKPRPGEITRDAQENRPMALCKQSNISEWRLRMSAIVYFNLCGLSAGRRGIQFDVMYSIKSRGQTYFLLFNLNRQFMSQIHESNELL